MASLSIVGQPGTALHGKRVSRSECPTLYDRIGWRMAMNAESHYVPDFSWKLTAFLDRDPNVIFAVLFGSAAAGTLGKESDIDIGIYFRNPPEGLGLLNLIDSLSNLMGRDVDVVVLNRASAFLRHQVMKTKVNLIIKDEVAYRTFREKTLSDYDEYKYVSGMDVYDR